MKPRKAFKDLNFCDDFLFTAAMEDETVCKEVLQCILEFPIKKVVVHKEHSLVVSPEHRGIRMDVHADDEDGTVFAIEMQTTDKGDLPQRSRYYAAQLDLLDLEPGDSYKKLRKSYIIFICTFDPFNQELYRYTFEERSLERDMSLGDGTCKIFLNTRGKNRTEVSAGLLHFLRFVENSELCAQGGAAQEDALIINLHKRISEIKRNRRMEERYMSFEERLEDERLEARTEGRAEGRAEGLQRGEERTLALIAAMLEDHRTLEEVRKIGISSDFKEEMLKQYKIKV